jgi:hypothetical protein
MRVRIHRGAHEVGGNCIELDPLTKGTFSAKGCSSGRRASMSRAQDRSILPSRMRQCTSRPLSMVWWLLPTMALLAVLSLPSRLLAQSISFNDLPPGTVLRDQFQPQGLRFVPFEGRVSGVIAQSGSGRVARFDVCEGLAECEFFASGAKGIFSRSQNFLRIQAGLIAASIQSR